ncbi:Pycsar system effector family protein [Actinomadura luteofluorescens]
MATDAVPVPECLGDSLNEGETSGEEFAIYAEKLLHGAREEVKQADAKASLLLAASGVAFGAILSAALAGSAKLSASTTPAAWAWWTGLGLAAAGVILLGLAVYPRTRRSADVPLHLVAYFGDIANYPRDTLEARVIRTLASPATPTLDQLYEVAHIAAGKYALIRRSLCLFATATGLGVVGLLLHLTA